MASRLAVLALSATTVSRARTAPHDHEPPSDGHHQQQQQQQQRLRRPPVAATSRRRLAAAAVIGTALLSPGASPPCRAGTFDLRITLPEQSSEEAEAVVRAHARNLVRVKQLIDAGAWREMQAALRASASNLKQDLYAIIQARPAAQRPDLRRLYSDLFNSVTSLDYAARDKDELQVQEHYGNMVATLDEIFAKIM